MGSQHVLPPIVEVIRANEGVAPAPQRTLELLGNCARQFTVPRPAWCKVFHRVRTALPVEPKTIGEHVHRKRKELGLHQWQLTKLLKVVRSTLGSWEANHFQPEGSARERVITWLGFDPKLRK